MRKDNTRDYVTEAFRFYVLNGSNAKKFRYKLRKQALETIQRAEGSYGISKPTESALIRAEQMLEQKAAEILEMEAAEEVVRIFEVRGKEKIKALKMVYLQAKEIEKGDIMKRVHKASLEIPLGEATVYRYLREARLLFAELRGLRKNN